MKSTEFIEKLTDIAKNYKTLYVMGCFGAPLTGSNVTRYTTNHSYNKQAARTAMIKAAANKTPPVYGFDCVCLIKGVLWGWCGNAAKTYGGASYACNGVPDIGADTMITKCTGVTTDFSGIVPGAAVWCSGHIGVYIGDGLAVECSPKWANNVQITAVANLGTKAGYNARTWTKWGKLPYIKYEAQAPAPSASAGTTEQKAFIAKVGAMAAADMKKSGILASLTIAQAILESGWGKSGLTASANNLFGIKGEYNGQYYEANTQEWDGTKYVTTKAKFRKYPSWAESLADHSALFNRLDRYKNLRGLTDYKLACQYVREDGYATDPKYTAKLVNIIETYGLTQYDTAVGGSGQASTPAKAYAVGDVVEFAGGYHYSSSQAKTATGGKRTAGTAKITQIAKGAAHPYHLVKVTGGGSNVYGWVDADTINDAAAAVTTYTVKAGDSLWAIAAKLLGNGARYKEIKAANGLTSDTIHPGDALKIPLK